MTLVDQTHPAPFVHYCHCGKWGAFGHGVFKGQQGVWYCGEHDPDRDGRTRCATLTSWESRMCTWVGKQRFANAKRLDRDPGLGPSTLSDEHHIRGAHCEFAASIMTNLYWRPSIGELKSRDIGGLVEVRSTVRETGRLIVKPSDPDHAPFALIVADMQALQFRFAGWLFAREAKAWPLLTDHGDPAHFVEQSALRSRASLADMLMDAR